MKFTRNFTLSFECCCQVCGDELEIKDYQMIGQKGDTISIDIYPCKTCIKGSFEDGEKSKEEHERGRENRQIIEDNEFDLAWLVTKGRIIDLPNVTFVIEKYVEQIKKQNAAYKKALDDAGWYFAGKMEEVSE